MNKKGLGLVEVILATGVLSLAAVCVLGVLAPAIRTSEHVNAHQCSMDAVTVFRQSAPCEGVFFYDTHSGVLRSEGGAKALRLECTPDVQMESGHHYEVAVYQGNTLLYATRMFF